MVSETHLSVKRYTYIVCLVIIAWKSFAYKLSNFIIFMRVLNMASFMYMACIAETTSNFSLKVMNTCWQGRGGVGRGLPVSTISVL
jgi:hypothetical protein